MKRFRVISALLLALILFVCLPVPALAAVDVSSAVSQSAQWLKENVPEPTLGDEEVLLALLRGEFITGMQEYTQGYLRQVQAHLQAGGAQQQSLETSAKQALALTAAGIDLKSEASQLLKALGDRAAIDAEGAAAQRAVLLLFGASASAAGQTSLDVQALAADFAATANPDGGFGPAGVSDIFSTAYALQALGTYREAAGVEEALLYGEMWLQLRTNDFGGFDVEGQANAEATALVILAVSAMGYDPDLISYESAPLIEALDVFRNENGSFSANPDAEPDVKLTALCALAFTAKLRYDRGKPAAYDFSDAIAAQITQAPAGETSQPGASSGVQSAPPVTQPADGEFPVLLLAAILLVVMVLLIFFAVFFTNRRKPKGKKKTGASPRESQPASPKKPTPAKPKKTYTEQKNRAQQTKPKQEKYTYRK